ncbi:MULTISPECIES: zinc ribbon domain-containing protein [unclassified Lentimonas]|uniref:FmdB family zinc ribbon protein n=1 Tax=unclassified Lentimonas TaxID=2630993 RepID=UPI001FD16484|nr:MULTISPECIES: zinc ribbon domain-containing protein [unclassified Lentimonas]
MQKHSTSGMPTYVYETIPSEPKERAVQFEVQQSMKDAPLTVHPETGQAVKRVISGGYGYASKSSSGGGHSCGHGCGCG